MRPSNAGMQGGWPRPGRGVIALLAINIVFYVLELALMRAGVPVAELFLTPAEVFDAGKFWQVGTYWWLHSPARVMHLLFNMLWLWMFGTQVERWWGTKRFAIAYVIFGFGGAALTLIVALLSRTDVFGPLLGGAWTRPHVGASGPVMGVLIAWGMTLGNQTMNFLFLGQMKAKTFMLIIIAIELLTALSFDEVSSSSHFGGMIAAFILCRGLWRPSEWQGVVKKIQLARRRKKIEHQLRILEGGKGDPPKDPRDWN
jgi:membrane associated rhomboid family serine protease